MRAAEPTRGMTGACLRQWSGVHSETAHYGTRLASGLVLEIEAVCVTAPAEGKSPAARRGQIDERGAGSTLDVRLNGRTEWLRSIHPLRRNS